MRRELLGGLFDSQDICRMATCDPSDAVGWGSRVGRLRAGLHADLLVVARREEDVYRNLGTSIEADVLLVTINGYPMYGVPALMQAGAAVAPESIALGEAVGERVVSLRDERIEDADMSWDEVVAALERVRSGAPAARLASGAGGGGARPPFQLIPDMPWDSPAGSARVAALDLREAKIGPLDSLVHDDAYFDAIDRATLHGGVLSGLRAYYAR